jgi:hypothetical protein
MTKVIVIALMVCGSLVTLVDEARASSPIVAIGDKYMYPFINDDSSQGRRPTASVFGAYGEIDDPSFDFDDRDAQFFLDFATAGLVPPGKGSGNYRVQSLTVTIVVANENAFRYDPTFDPLESYLHPGSDADLGRPMELYGVGYRSGWTRSTFNEDSPFQTEPSSSFINPQKDWNRKRNAFAMDFDANGLPRDISNNVDEQFEVRPWAVADSPGFIDLDGNYVESALAAGSPVPEGRVLRFRVNLNDPNIVTYLQDSLDAGRLHLMVSSLLETSQGSFEIPRFYTKDNGLDVNLSPQIEAEVVLLPLISLSPTLGGWRIQFDTLAGQSYQLEYRDSLTSGEWQPLGSLLQGTGETLTYEDTSATGPSRFYRIAVHKSSAS